MSLTIQYSQNDDFHKWASMGLKNNYMIPVRELLPKSVYGNLAKKIDKIAEVLIDNNLNFSDLKILSKYISSDGKFIKSASTNYEDVEKLNKISCIISHKEVFRYLVKTSGLLSWVGGIAGWLSLIPVVGAVFSGIASAAYFAQGDWVSGILYLVGIVAAFFGGGIAVKGLQILIRLIAKGGTHLTKALKAGGMLAKAKTALGIWDKFGKAIVWMMRKLRITGKGDKYVKSVEKWFASGKKTLEYSVKAAEKTKAAIPAQMAAIKTIDGLIRTKRGSAVLLRQLTPRSIVDGKIIVGPRRAIGSLTTLQKSMLRKNLSRANRAALKSIVDQERRGGLGAGTVLRVGAGSASGLLAFDMLTRDDTGAATAKDTLKHPGVPEMFETILAPAGSEAWQEQTPFAAEL